MDYRIMLLMSVVLLVGVVQCAQGRTKKVVIHVPVKVKKIKHTHTIIKTVHHHHRHHDPHVDHAHSPSEEHEHFHHMHLHDEVPAALHNQAVAGILIPDFLPDVPDVPMDLPLNHREGALPHKHSIPLYRRS